MSKVYSPTQTATWTRCPMLRALTREGWTPKRAGKVRWAAILGKAFAAGLGVYNNLRKAAEGAGMPMPPRANLVARKALLEASIGTAKAVMAKELEESEKIGYIVDSSDQLDYLPKLPSRLEKALSCYILEDPLPDTTRIIDVEKDFGPEAGNARADLIVEERSGLAVIDYKSKVVLEARFRLRTIDEYANSHQQFHYAHFAGKAYNQPVNKYYIGLAVIEPRWGFEFLPFPVQEENLLAWYESAKQIWGDMEAEDRGERLPWLSASHYDKWGKCPMYNACFVHKYDPALMAAEYLHLERVKLDETAI